MFPFKPNKQYTTIALYAGAVIAAAILFGVLLFNIGVVLGGIASLVRALSSIIFALVISYLTSPLVLRFERLILKLQQKRKARASAKVSADASADTPADTDAKESVRTAIPSAGVRVAAIAATFLLLFLILYVFSRFLLPLLVGDGAMLTSRLRTIAERITGLVNSLGDKFGYSISVEQLLGFLGSFASTIANVVLGIGRGFTLTMFNMIVGICLSMGILFHRRALLGAVRHTGAALFSLRTFRYLERLSFYANRIFGKYLIGKIVECSIVGLLYLIILPILGVPYPFLITVIMTVTNFIPIIGAILGGIPSAILILTGENPWLVIWFTIIVLAVEQLDGNIIFPKVIGSVIDLRAVWIMVAVALFGGFFGIVGMFLSPPLFAIIYTLIRDFTNHRLKKKGYPTKTDFYEDKFSSTAKPRRHRLSHKRKQSKATSEGGDEK